MPVMNISEINILPRQRQSMDSPDYKDHIETLAKSIKQFGLLQPVVIDEQNNLVAGFTRIQAHLHLGITEIEFKRAGELTEIERKEMELEENIRRKNLEWWEEANAIAEIDELKRVQDPNWSMTKTAEAVGKSVGTVSQMIDLKKALGEDPDIKKEQTLRGALKKRKNQKQLEQRKKEIELKKKGKLPSIPAEIRVGDAAELIAEEPDESFDAVVTNFPFGVDLEYKNSDEIYYDDEEYIVELVQQVVKHSYRVLKDNSWFVGFFDIRKITYSNAQLAVYKKLHSRANISAEDKKLLYDSMGLTYWLQDAGFDYVNLLPAVWVKPNKTVGLIGDPNKGLVSSYEALVFASKGNALFLKKGLQNVFVCDTPTPSERVHQVQMPTELCSHIVSMVSLGGGRILDPFAGSGAVGLGALERQCEFVGYELNPDYASNGNLRLQEHIFSEDKEDEH